MPDVVHNGGPEVALPQPLSPSEAAELRRIFALQSRGAMSDAIRASANLGDPLLMGRLLADRYLGRHYRSTAAQLSDWLDTYHNQPDAPAIRSLLLTKLPKGAPMPAAVDVAPLSRSAEPESTAEDAAVDRNDLPPRTSLDRPVMDRAQAGNTEQALRLIAATRTISRAYAARLRAEVAQVLFIRNDDGGALRVIEDSIQAIAPADQNSLTYYVGGLAAWRLDRPEEARHLFESGAQATLSSPRLRAASAFWASRVNQRLHHAVPTLEWLKRAADERMTFHGILARRMLHMDIGIVPSGELLTDADVDAVAATPEGFRAFALLQIGQPDRAEAELRLLWPRMHADPVFGRSVLMVASATGLSDFASQLATLLQARDGPRFDALRFPIPRLQPSGGFRVDPALIYALTRTESHFDPEAISPNGARGLMQIMPATAQYIAADLGGAEERLREPAFNLQIGQRYVTYLSQLNGIDSDLIRLLASYNAGPGNLLRWTEDIRDSDDPLLFIEAIPIRETRNFVPDVLAASWIYAARLHRPSPSLDSLAGGRFPRFTPLPTVGKMANAALRVD